MFFLVAQSFPQSIYFLAAIIFDDGMQNSPNASEGPMLPPGGQKQKSRFGLCSAERYRF